MTTCQMIGNIVLHVAIMHSNGFTQKEVREVYYKVPEAVLAPIIINEYNGTSVVPPQRKALAAELACETTRYQHKHWRDHGDEDQYPPEGR